MKPRVCYLTLNCVLFLSVACLDAPDQNSSDDQQASEALIAGELLASVNVTDTHRIEFWETLDHGLVVIEDRHADLDGDSQTSSFDPSTQSLTNWYLYLVNDAVNLEELNKLATLENRLADADVLARVDSASATTTNAYQPQVSDVIERGAVSKHHSIGYTPSGWDWVADGQWYLGQHCNIGHSGPYGCYVNRSWFTWAYSSASASATFFNQHFSDTHAYLHLEYQPGCTPGSSCHYPYVNLVTLRPLPRHIMSTNTWSGTGNYNWRTRAQGQRIGLSVYY